MSVRVLVVDDDPLIRRAISKLLAREGFDVSEADDARPWHVGHPSPAAVAPNNEPTGDRGIVVLIYW